VADERFLVLINDLLASGEIPDLFPDDEVENVINAMRPEVKAAGMYDSKENCWKFFINRVRRTLKVVRAEPSARVNKVKVKVPVLDYRAYGSGSDPGSWQTAFSEVSHKPGGRLPILGFPQGFPPSPQLSSQPLRGLLPVSLLGEPRHDGCEQFA